MGMVLTPKICIRSRDRKDGWLRMDLWDDELGLVVIPTYGDDHNAGMDCWCRPRMVDGEIVVHGVCH